MNRLTVRIFTQSPKRKDFKTNDELIKEYNILNAKTTGLSFIYGEMTQKKIDKAISDPNIYSIEVLEETKYNECRSNI
jgi:hypothetical protein